MSSPAHFRVDPRLAQLLGESYRSTEQALKELIDNAWDADAEHVDIVLPEAITDAPIVVKDDGCGMTEADVRAEYLNIASDRRTRKGDRTQNLSRPVKGRKGIGKFAGLVAAEVMEVETRTRGRKTLLRLVKQTVIDAQMDLEKIKLPISSEGCDRETHGTTITLSDLNQSLSIPQADALRRLLVLDYGRERNFEILVNGQPLDHEDIPGQQFAAEADLPEAGRVKLRVTIVDEPLKSRQAGIVIRVGGKVVGRPQFFGLDEREDLPKKLLRRLVGEIEADSIESAVTADWGALLESNKAVQDVRSWVLQQINPQIDTAFKKEIDLARARIQKEINRRLAQLPENRRNCASQYITRILEKLYGDSEERITTVVSLVLDAMEQDEYFVVCQAIEEARQSDVVAFAESLEKFGLVDLAVIAQQATQRLKFLAYLDELAANPKTLEQQMHQALDRNLWVFGSAYSLMSSNATLARVIEDYTGKKFKGKGAKNRPDLLLSEDVRGHRLLIEFKRPSKAVDRKAEAQAKEYRDALTPSHGKIDIIVIGGTVDGTMSALYPEAGTEFKSYSSAISTARTQLEWLLSELTTDRPLPSAPAVYGAAAASLDTGGFAGGQRGSGQG
jgi:hypothetical protein